MNFIQKLVFITDLKRNKYIGQQFICLICLLIYSCSSIIFPSYISRIVDEGIAEKNMQDLFMYISQMLICGFIMVIFSYVQKMAFYFLGNEISMKAKLHIFDKLRRANIFFWSENKVGNIITVLNDDVDKIRELLTSVVSDVIVNSFMLIGIGIYVLSKNMLIGGSVIILAIIFAYIQYKLSEKAKEKMKQYRDYIGDFNNFTTKVVNNFTSIQLTGKSRSVKTIYSEKYKNVINKGIGFSRIIFVLGDIGQLVSMLSIVITLCIGAIGVSKNILSIGLLFSMTVYVQRLYGPIISLSNSYTNIRSMSPIINNVYKMLVSSDEMINGKIKKDAPLLGKVDFINISFAYDNNKYLFYKFNYTFLPGEIVGICGHNGSGKTTLGRLLTKVCRVQEGKILIDGINIDDFDTDYLNDQIGYMTQDCFILSEDIQEIVSEKNSFDKLKLYMKEMGLVESHLDVENLIINDNKLNISGGEAQKIVLFKLFLENKPICILDEPTSALDEISERKVIKFIEENFKYKTVLIITHNKNILKICNHVINLD